MDFGLKSVIITGTNCIFRQVPVGVVELFLPLNNSGVVLFVKRNL
jgi:hypothetical protein